jgi:hypothetical protein
MYAVCPEAGWQRMGDRPGGGGGLCDRAKVCAGAGFPVCNVRHAEGCWCG